MFVNYKCLAHDRKIKNEKPPKKSFILLKSANPGVARQRTKRRVDATPSGELPEKF